MVSVGHTIAQVSSRESGLRFSFFVLSCHFCMSSQSNVQSFKRCTITCICFIARHTCLCSLLARDKVAFKLQCGSRTLAAVLIPRMKGCQYTVEGLTLKLIEQVAARKKHIKNEVCCISLPEVRTLLMLTYLFRALQYLLWKQTLRQK